jgi:hypothetical protein
MTPTADDFSDLNADQARKRAVVTQLAKLVQHRFLMASTEKAGITETIEKCRRVMRGEPVTGVHADPEIPVTYPLTPPIVEGLVALLANAVTVSSATEAFVLKPTAQPTLPEEANLRIMQELTQMQQHLAELGVAQDFDAMMESAKHLEAAARTEQNEQALEQAGALQARVKDKLQETGFTGVFAELIRDFCTYPAVIVKAPAVQLRQVRSWNNGRLAFEQKLVRGVERIDPGMIFPAPGAFGMQPENSEYVCELRRLNPTDLSELATSPDYDADEVMRVMATYPMGRRELFAGLPGYQNLGLNGAALSELSPLTASGNFDAIVHCGRIQGRLLTEFGVIVPDELRSYEAEVVVIGDCVIRAALNPDAGGRRPYHHTSFFPISNSVWGDSPCTRLFHMQRAATSLFVSLLADAALAGVHIELDPSLLHSDDKVEKTSVRPRQIRIVKQTGATNRARAYDLFNVQAQTAAFSAEIERLHAVCFELVGVSRLSLGQQAGAGTIGRTAGGVAALLNQTSMPIKQAVLNMEAHLIEPVVQAFVDFELTWAKEGEFAGDVNVMARGLSGLLEQQGNVDDLTFAMQSLTGIADKVNPETGKSIVPPDAIPMLLQAIFQAKGIDTDGLFDKDYSVSAALKGTSFGQQPSQVGGGIPLNNMGTQAAAAIQASNNPMGASGAPPTAAPGAHP